MKIEGLAQLWQPSLKGHSEDIAFVVASPSVYSPVKGVCEDLDPHQVSHGRLFQGGVHCPGHHSHPPSLPVENKLLGDHCLVDEHGGEPDHPPDDVVQQPREEEIYGSSCMLSNTSEPWPEAAICAFIYRGREEIGSVGEGTHYIRICGPGQPNIRIFTANEQW